MLVWTLFLVIIGEIFADIKHVGVRYIAQDDVYNIVEGDDITKYADEVACEATYDNSIQDNGWAHISVTTNAKFADTIQARCGGYVEGFLTQPQYSQHWQNFISVFQHSYGMDYIPHELHHFMDMHWNWVRTYSFNKRNENPVNWQVYLDSEQILGFLGGYRYAVYKLADKTNVHDLTLNELLIFNSEGDLYQIMDYLFPKLRASRKLDTREGALEYQTYMNDCSALIKLVDDDVLVGHTTFTYYAAMLRIFKVYTFNYANVASATISFSSKFGYIFSKDDYLIASPKNGTNIWIGETTNSVYTDEAINKVSPFTYLIWERTTAATRLAYNSKQWHEYFVINHSGTYSNQWMTLDINRYENGKLKEGAFYVTEEIPGLYHTEDLTQKLNQDRYWPSFNIPYFEDIRVMSGVADKEAKYGDDYSWTNAPRARMMARDHNEIIDFAAFARYMRYNNYKNDDISLGNPANAISARNDLPLAEDLPAKKRTAFGGIDTKATSKSILKRDSHRTYAQAGPTHVTQEPFCWSKFYEKNPDAKVFSHVGQPDCFNFDFVWMNKDGINRIYNENGKFEKLN